MSAPHPTLTGARVTLRPGRPEDVDILLARRAEPSVVRWWAVEQPRAEIEAELLSAEEEVVLVIEADGEVAGAIHYYEELDPEYHHASIDIYLGGAFQGRGLGPEAIRVLARFLFDRRGHHRLTIDPAVANERAIRSYESVGFRRVGVLREYERGRDGTFHDGLLMDMLRDELTSG